MCVEADYGCPAGATGRQEEIRVAETELTAVVSMTGHVSEVHSLVAKLLQMRDSASFRAHFCN